MRIAFKQRRPRPDQLWHYSADERGTAFCGAYTGGLAASPEPSTPARPNHGCAVLFGTEMEGWFPAAYRCPACDAVVEADYQNALAELAERAANSQ